jgi:uncharacterized cysteine cluster protein YcgN (CxxCxxCC family)
MPDETPYWKRKTLAEMTESEWEGLCDGCGRCCLVKLEEDLDEETDASDETDSAGKRRDNPRIWYTDVGCRLLDSATCRCRDYENRSQQVPDCVRLDPQVVEEIGWLPPSCAYRLVAEGRDLYWWHPLVSGDPDTVHQAGVSVRGRVSASEDDLTFDEIEERIVSWPLSLPKRARAARPK